MDGRWRTSDVILLQLTGAVCSFRGSFDDLPSEFLPTSMEVNARFHGSVLIELNKVEGGIVCAVVSLQHSSPFQNYNRCAISASRCVDR